jgi:glycosyltransferase involved in cell wall biosynthesis
MKISIVTACFNNKGTIDKCLTSVANQSYDNIEHVIIDGGSDDGTIDIIKSYNHVVFFSSEKDKGIYDALNKGLKAATGDIIGFLHSDDVFKSKDVISQVASFFQEEKLLDGVYGDIEFVNEDGKQVRYYSSKKFKEEHFAIGKMPAHTSFFARKLIYNQFDFKLGYKIAADYDQMLRVFLSKQFKVEYRPLLTTSMLTGGASTKNIQSRITINQEILKSCKENGVKTNALKVYGKYIKKVFEFKT